MQLQGTATSSDGRRTWPHRRGAVILTTVLAFIVCAALVVPGAALAATGTLVFEDGFTSMSRWHEIHDTYNFDMIGWGLDSGLYTSGPYSAGHVPYGSREGSELWQQSYINLSGATSATLKFKAWYNLSPGSMYKVFVANGDELDYWGDPATYKVAEYTGLSGGFVDKVVDISAFAGHPVKVMFRLVSTLDVPSWVTTSGGVRVDDVQVWTNGTGTATWGGTGATGGGVGTPALDVTSISRAPSKAKLSYKRKKGVARFKLSATVRSAGGAMPGVTATLQTSKNGKRGWKNSYKMATDASGVALKSFAVKKKSTVYYRWVVGAKTTSAQRVIVK